MANCTGMRCPMQAGYKVDECNYKDCPWRTEQMTNADRIRAMSDEETGYCPICDKEVGELDVVPTRCIDPIMQYCQGCRYGYIDYPSWAETEEDLEGCCFDSGCIFGLEDTQPTEEEIKEFEERYGIEI